MMMNLLLAAAAFAAPSLSPDGSYPVKKELQNPAPAATVLTSLYSEVVVDFETFEDPNKSTPFMTSHNDQLIKARRLPADPKDPNLVRSELTYERMVSASVVQVPVLGAYPTRVDLGSVLASHPVLMRGDASGMKKVDNMADVKAAALGQAKDVATRSTANMLLTEESMLKAANSFHGPSCVDALAGKQPGAKWKVNEAIEGAARDYECAFEGWSEAGGKKVAVIKFTATRQREPRKQVDGSMGMAETEGEGDLLFVPETGETVMRMTSRILNEPSADKIKQLEAAGQLVKRSHSTMKFHSHVYAI